MDTKPNTLTETDTTPAPLEIWRPFIANGRHFHSGGLLRSAVPFEMVDIHTEFYGRGRAVSVVVPDGITAETIDAWLLSAFPAGRSPKWLTTRAWVGDILIEADKYSAGTRGGEMLSREMDPQPTGTMGGAIIWTAAKIRQALDEATA